MNVLSLFDGISCGRLALERAGIQVDKYYASEIEPSAIKIAQKNWADTIQLGDVTNWRKWNIDWSSIDLLIGGSPCQGFSIAGNKLNFNDPRSKLFFEYVDILNHIKSFNPHVKFLLENVKMREDYAKKISGLLGCDYLYIDSRYFTGMIRKRYYWTNIKVSNIPNHQTKKIKDLIENVPFDKSLDYLLSKTIYSPTISSDGIITINPRDKNGKQTWQRGRVYDINGTCPTICATLFDLSITEDHKTYRKLTITECESLQGLPKGYTEGIPYTKRGEVLGNGWTVDVIAHIFSCIPK